MSLYAKLERVKEMCRLIGDATSKKHATTFCNELKTFLSKRNDIVHSLYGVRDEKVVRIKVRAKPDEILQEVSLEQLDDVEKEIMRVTGRFAPWVDKVKDDRMNAKWVERTDFS